MTREAAPGHPLVVREPSALQRLLIVTGIAVVVGTIAEWFAPWQFSVLVGWDVAGAWFVGWVWFSVRRFSAEQTRALATREDNSRFAAHVLLLSASVASLGGAGFTLEKASEAEDVGKAALIAVAVIATVVSWAVVHTVYAVRYAHEFYTEPVGGIDFNNDEAPDYQDFAYLAFTVGMTFQVSDTDVQRRTIRRTVLRHALLSYLFGAVILAATVNVIASVL